MTCDETLKARRGAMACLKGINQSIETTDVAVSEHLTLRFSRRVVSMDAIRSIDVA